MKDGSVLPPHALSQLEPQLFLKVGAIFFSTDRISVRVAHVYLIPSPELLHSQNLIRPEVPCAPSQPPS